MERGESGSAKGPAGAAGYGQAMVARQTSCSCRLQRQTPPRAHQVPQFFLMAGTTSSALVIHHQVPSCSRCRYATMSPAVSTTASMAVRSASHLRARRGSRQEGTGRGQEAAWGGPGPGPGRLLLSPSSQRPRGQGRGRRQGEGRLTHRTMRLRWMAKRSSVLLNLCTPAASAAASRGEGVIELGSHRTIL